MRAAKTTRAEAIVLKAMDYGETDRILTLYTRESGKVRAIAKGVRRTTSRMGGHLDLFTHASVLLVHGRNLAIVTQGEGRQAFIHLREDLHALATACYVTELTDRLTGDADANPELFRALVRVLEHLDSGRGRALSLALYQLQALALSGYRPQLHHCVLCGTPIVPGPNGFDAALGGAVCAACAPAQPAARPISTAALKILRNVQTRGEAMFAVAVPEAALEEAESALATYIHHLLERRPNSAAFLEMTHRSESPVARFAPTGDADVLPPSNSP